MQLPEALFKRLVQTHAIEIQNKSAIVVENEQVELPSLIVGQYLNGYTFARYMIVLKLLVVSRKFRLKSYRNKDKTKILTSTSRAL